MVQYLKKQENIIWHIMLFSNLKNIYLVWFRIAIESKNKLTTNQTNVCNQIFEFGGQHANLEAYKGQMEVKCILLNLELKIPCIKSQEGYLVTQMESYKGISYYNASLQYSTFRFFDFTTWFKSREIFPYSYK